MLLEIRALCRTYPGAGEVLRDVDLTVTNGQTVAITGPSGSGKSTLLNLIGALDRPTSGRIRIDGQELARFDDNGLARLRRHTIGLIFQSHHLLPHCTAFENCLLPAVAAGTGRSSTVRQRASTLLEQVGLGDRRDAFPAQLSGGECQRVAVVRALINRPSLLLADEPTGSLDAETSAGLADLLLRLNSELGTTLVVVTHSHPLAGRLDRHLRLHNGQLIEEEATP